MTFETCCLHTITESERVLGMYSSHPTQAHTQIYILSIFVSTDFLLAADFCVLGLCLTLHYPHNLRGHKFIKYGTLFTGSTEPSVHEYNSAFGRLII